MVRASAACTMAAVLGPSQWRSASLRTSATAPATSKGLPSMAASTRSRAASTAARVTRASRQLTATL